MTTSASDTTELDRLRHPDEARAAVLAQAPLLPVETVPLPDAAWRVLANDLVATEDHPAFAASTMDGYAVVADDGSPWREVLGMQAAGDVLPLEVTPGTAVQIMTGAPLPPGADAVVRVEHTEVADDHVIIHQEEVTPGENIRPIGADVRAGDVVIAAGSVIGPAEIGLLASLGRAAVEVRRRPRASVISTGDELVEPGEPLRPGRIRDSNRFSLVAALQGAGAEVAWSGKGPDRREDLERMLRERIADSDIVVTTGGVSMGELDLIKPILGDLATVHFRRVFMKPGKPLNFATAPDGTLLFGLPGNPVSALVSFELLIRPAIAKMSGLPVTGPVHIPVRAGFEVQPTDRIEFQRVVLRVGPDGVLTASSTGNQLSSRLASLVGSNGLLVVPPRETPYPAGSMLEAIVTGPLQGEPVS